MIGQVSANIAIYATIIGTYFWTTTLARRRTWLTHVEVMFLVAAVSLGLLLVVALALAVVALFKAPLVALFAILYALSGWLVFSRPVPRVSTVGVSRWSVGLAAMAVLYAVATTWSASDFVLGGSDPGGYVAIAGNVAREGTVYHSNAAVAALPDDVADALVPRDDGRFMELSGMVADARVKGRTNPQFLHGYPALLAVFKMAFGILGMLRLPVLMHILAVGGLFLLVWRLFDSAITGALSSMLLATDLAQHYYARTPFSEVPNQFFFIAGAWTLVLALRHADRTLAILSAALWTIGCLVRADAYLAQAALFAAVACIPPESQAAPIRRPFAWTLFIGTIAAIFLTSITSWQTYLRVTIRETLAAWALAVGSGVLCLLSPTLWRYRIVRNAWEVVYRRAALVGWMFTVLLVAIVAWGYWIRPALPPEICSDPYWCYHMIGMRLYDEDTFVRLAWYISPIGLFAATIGAAGLVHRYLRQRDAVLLPFLTMGLAFSALFLWRQMNSPWHFWAFRRYIPVVLPFAVVCMSWTVVRLASLRRGASIAAAALGAYFAAFGIRMSIPFFNTKEMLGARKQVAQIAKLLPANAVLLSPYPLLPHSILLTPLESLYGFDVVRLPERVPNPHTLETALSVWRMQRRPVVFFCEPEVECFWPAERSVLRRRCDAAIDAQRARSSFDHAPDSVERIYAGFVAYDVVDAEAKPPQWWDAPGNYGGFYPPEEWHGRRYRWSGADAELGVMAPSGSRELMLIAAANGPKPVEVILSVGDQIERYTLEPGFDKVRDLRIVVPEHRSDRLLVHITSSTFKPTQWGSSDPRQLGVAIFGVRVGANVLTTSPGES